MLVAWSRARPPHPSLPAMCLGRGCLMAAGGRVPLLPDRAIYLINLVIKVATQVTWSLSHRLLQPRSPGFEGGGWPPPSCSLCSPWRWLWVPRGQGATMKQYKLVMRETHVHIPVLAVSGLALLASL